MQKHSVNKILLISLIAVFLFAANFASAQNVSELLTQPAFVNCGPGDLYACVEEGISLLLRYVTFIPAIAIQYLISVGTDLINFMLAFNAQVFNLDTNHLLKNGFGVVLDITNLGFVLAIIIIAFATILRIESYAIKKTLWKLIVAALLVNFSLVIAAPIVDFNNALAAVFVNQGAGGDPALFTNNIMAAFNPQKLLSVRNDISDVEGVVFKLISLVLAPIFMIIFGAITAIVMFVTGFMLLIRYIMLTILLLLMPLAWLMWIFPNLSHLWRNWWSKFLQWNFFLPAATFFIYLALVTVDKIGESINQHTASSQIARFVNDGLLIQDALGLFLQIIISAGLMVGGLMAANSMSISGADMGLRWAGAVKNFAIGQTGAVKNFAIGQTGRIGLRAGSWPLRTQIGRNIVAGMQKVPLLRTAGAGLANIRMTAEKQILKPYEQSIKGLSLEEIARRYKFAPKPMKMLILSELARNKRLDLIKMEPAVANELLEGLKLGFGRHETMPKKKRRKN